MNDARKSRKSNGSGYTYRVGNSWKTVIEVGGRRITATNKSKQESRRLAKEKASKVGSTNSGSVAGAHRLTLNDFLLPWLDSEHKLKIAHSTYRRYRGIAKHYILPAMGNHNLQRISKKEIAQFLNSLLMNNVKARTRNQALALLSVAFGGAIESGMIDSNPTNGIRKAAEDKKPIKPLTEEEVLALLATSSGSYMQARLHIAFAGLRQGEVLGLRWRNIDLEKGSVSIEEQVQKVDGKSTWVKLKSSMSVRVIYISSASIDALKKHKAIIAECKVIFRFSASFNYLAI